ncbi:hypothetical protein LCGC14_2336370 [marine sediment metagenome]|uniref:Uncharacterized protein n=1 Tax=marine sediment metagenome TaxID=412755 RepID=A0A0F9ER60_9ZZZZ|nr:hypothetical protein [Candidatus Scalindua sp.]
MLTKERANQAAEVYIDEGFKATATLRRIEPGVKEKSKGYQYLKAHRLIHSDRVQERLRDLLEDRGLNNEDITRLLKRNAKQSKNLPASNQALDMAIKIKGEYAPSKSVRLTVDYTDQQLDEAIGEKLKELKELNG